MTSSVDLKACLGGSKSAWDAFVDRYARVVYAAVQRTLGAHADPCENAEVEDVAQDVFVRLVKDDYRLLRTYDPAKAALTTWLTIVARSVAVDRVRRRRLRTVPLDEAPAPASPAPDADEPPTAALDLPVDLLTPRQRLVLQLLFDEGLSVAEAADVLGVGAQTVRSTKHKALQRLRAALRR